VIDARSARCASPLGPPLLSRRGPRGEGRAARDLAEGTPASGPIARFARRRAGSRRTPSGRSTPRRSTWSRPARPNVGTSSRRRPAARPFLARLVEVYASGGYRARDELPDHLAESWRSWPWPRHGGAGRPRAGRLLPALARMLEGFQDRENPYRELLVAVQELLRPARSAARVPAQPEVRR